MNSNTILKSVRKLLKTQGAMRPESMMIFLPAKMTLEEVSKACLTEACRQDRPNMFRMVLDLNNPYPLPCEQIYEVRS